MLIHFILWYQKIVTILINFIHKALKFQEVVKLIVKDANEREKAEQKLRGTPSPGVPFCCCVISQNTNLRQGPMRLRYNKTKQATKYFCSSTDKNLGHCAIHTVPNTSLGQCDSCFTNYSFLVLVCPLQIRLLNYPVIELHLLSDSISCIQSPHFFLGPSEWSS